MLEQILGLPLWLKIVSTVGLGLGLCKLIFASPSRPRLEKSLEGQVIIVTGSSAGIGFSTVQLLATTGAKIILACRNKEKTIEAIEQIKQKLGGNLKSELEFMRLDLSDLKQVEEFAGEFQKKYKRLDILINNAGLFHMDLKRTAQGLEEMFGVNHLGPFYLTQLLLPVLEKTPTSRVVMVASDAHLFIKNFNDEQLKIFQDPKKEDVGFRQYSRSKLANIMFAKSLQEQLDPKKTRVVSLHPGFVRTEIGRDANWYQFLFYKIILAPIVYATSLSLEQGAYTTLVCALKEFEELTPGGYYADRKLRKDSPQTIDKEAQKKLWDLSQ